MAAQKPHEHLIGLDGLRAIAVTAVILFHADLAWTRGGYLGVDLFFVISGFLITYLLVAEKEKTGTISLSQFYLRRAKRLLPASWLMITATIIAAAFVAPDALNRLRADALASLAYVTNWELIYNGQSYFEAMGRQPLLLHLWSLAIEEQFYLLWAPIVFFVLPRLQRRILVIVALTLAISSCLWMLYQVSAINLSENADPTRLYFGTDTHGFPLLIGALLGLLWRPMSNTISFGIGAGALIGLIAILTGLGQETEWLYPWGFLLCAGVSAILIWTTVSGGTLGALLDKEPLRWIGQRSYGIYLWHWPIFMMTRPELDMQLDDITIFLIRVTLTLVIAAISYRYIEMPIRSGALSRLSKRTLAFASVPSVAVITIAAGILLTGKTQALPQLDLPQQGTASLRPQACDVGSDSESLDCRGLRPRSDAVIAAKPIKTEATIHGSDVTAIGDSVLLGAKPVLEHELPGAKVMAKVSKQAAAVLKEVQHLYDSKTLTSYVLVHLGTNGYVTEKQLREILGLLKNQKRVVLVNTKVPRQWARANNAMMARVVADYPNTVLDNWNQIADHHPEYFVADGVHLTARGQHAFVSAIKSKLVD